MLGAWGRVRGRLGLGIRSAGLLPPVLGRETWEGAPKDHQRAFRGVLGEASLLLPETRDPSSHLYVCGGLSPAGRRAVGGVGAYGVCAGGSCEKRAG